MQTQNEKKISKSLIITFAGIAFLILYIPIATPIHYPDFIPFETEAPNTVHMVIEELLGPVYQFDLFWDFPVYLVLSVLCLRLHIGLQKTLDKNNRKRNCFIRPLVFLLITFGLYLTYDMIPFYLNGNLRFRFTYLVFFLYKIAESVAIFEMLFCYVSLGECMTNHSYNTVTLIILMIAAFAGFIQEVLSFYQLTISSYVYYAVQTALFAVVFHRLWKHKKYILSQ